MNDNFFLIILASFRRFLFDTCALSSIEGRCIDMNVKVRSTDPGLSYRKFEIRFADNGKSYSTIEYDPIESIVKIDRKHSGSRRAIVHQRRCRVANNNGEITLRMILDRYSMELFINDVISFDPNYRKPLWKSVDEAVMAMQYGFEKCDVLKISDNEVELFTGLKDIEAGAKKIQKDYDIPIVFATLGAEGIMVLYKDYVLKKEGFKNPDAIETTGAGDTFCACAIDFVRRNGLVKLTEEKLSECLTFANAAASIITTRRGALSVMPALDEINAVVRAR